MKKILSLLVLLFSFHGFSQAISVSTNTYTVPQLVTDVLINSPCVSATNITWRTGTNYGSSNGIGFFQNTNANFPMQSGVILTTGSALNAAGPNSVLLNDGSANWVGDADLENTLSAAGIPMVSTNATVLEFDFTPISSSFDFDFIFASEEYGNYQCQFSDAFAFLLTNMNTGVTTNLAVVPSTNTPISVVTIRDFVYNSSCPSTNAQFFGAFNGGSAAPASPTNFNGQTKMLTASSSLVPNTPYHIKLVIADRTDYESDSAIFLSSNSFNLGQDVLGADLTVADNTAICPGSSYVITTTLNPATNTFSWTRNNQPLVGENGPTLTVTQPGTYALTYDNTTDVCPPITSDIEIEYYPEMVTPDPTDLFRCSSGATSYEYNLEFNTPIILAGLNPLTQISYHASMADANNNQNPLPLMYTAAPGQTVFVRIKSADTPCFIVKQFQLGTTTGPVPAQPQNMTSCQRSATNVNGTFVLKTQTVAILNGQSPTGNVVTYHTSLANANSGTNPINPNFYVGANNATIYVRMQNALDPDCFSITTFQLFVNPLPLVDTLGPVIVCDSYTLPALTNGNYFTEPSGAGTPLFAGDVISESSTIYIYSQSGGTPNCTAESSFTVTIINPNDFPTSGTYCTSYSLPSLEYGNYYTQANGAGTQIQPGTSITTTQTVHIYYSSPLPPYCQFDVPYTLTLLQSPNVPNYPPVINCTSYTLPVIPVGTYYTGPNGTGTMLPAGTVITTSQNIYVYAQTGTAPNICTDGDQFYVTIGFNAPQDVSQCGPYTLPNLPSTVKYFTGPNGTGTPLAEGSQITTTQTVYVYFPGSTGCPANVSFHVTISQPPVDTLSDVSICDNYTLPALTNGHYFTGPGGTGDALQPGDVISATQTIYIFAQLTSGCSNESSFTVTKVPPPAIDSRSDIDICNYYTLTELTAGNYYTGPNGTGTMLPAGTVLTESQTVYIYAETDTTPACSAQNSFDLFIFSVQADDPDDVVACDSYTLPPLTIGNYYILPDGPAGGEGTMMYAGDVITTSMPMYVYIESGERINCHDENEFMITINQTPVVPPVADKFACNAYTLPALTVGNYYTGPGATGTLLNAGDQITTNQTIYIYAETATVPNCTDEKSFNVTVFNVDDVADVTTCQSYILPTLTVGKYYTGSGGTGTQLAAGSAVTTSQTIYVYSASPFNPVCYDETNFVVTIVPVPVANPVPAAMTTVCDEDGNNDGFTSFDLTTLNATVLGTQTTPEFTFAYYNSLDDANNATNPITSTTASDVFVRVNNTLAPSCYDVQNIHITVNKLPVPSPVGGIICFDTETQTMLGSPFVLHSGLPSSGYTFKWTNEAGTVVGSGTNYSVTFPGTYTVVAKRIATGCYSEPVSVTVNPSEPALVSFTITEDFADSQSVTVVAIGSGDYDYQLDNGPVQDSPIFNNVSSGMHIVTVTDRNHCGISTSEALVINYPHYFTPNGDGFHDTWNIVDLREQINSKISIYDRFGKMITQIQPNGTGWDGTYNGHQLPSTDYWFVVNYTEGGENKEFRAHFAMKR